MPGKTRAIPKPRPRLWRFVQTGKPVTQEPLIRIFSGTFLPETLSPLGPASWPDVSQGYPARRRAESNLRPD